MPNIEKIYEFGSTVEIERGYSANYGKKLQMKSEKYRPTPEKVAEHNRKQAEKKLRRKIKANFTSDDWHMTLTYDKTNRPTAEQANEWMKKFMRKLRTYCKRNGHVLKYITVTEYEHVAIHHHFIINNFPGLFEFMKKNWPDGVNYSPIHDDDDVAELASYLIKETEKTFRNKEGRRLRYTCSRNLINPEPTKVSVHKVRGFGAIEVPKEYKGKYIIDTDSILELVNEFGHVHQSFTLKLIKENKQPAVGNGNIRKLQI
jgi:DNA-binding ferritin-like protein (Dps family)